MLSQKRLKVSKETSCVPEKSPGWWLWSKVALLAYLMHEHALVHEFTMLFGFFPRLCSCAFWEATKTYFFAWPGPSNSGLANRANSAQLRNRKIVFVSGISAGFRYTGVLPGMARFSIPWREHGEALQSPAAVWKPSSRVSCNRVM